MQPVRPWRLAASRAVLIQQRSLWSKKWLVPSKSNKPPWTPRRHFGLSSIPAILVPPTVFGGLFVTLWAYKCLMMVVFQNKIIYMPSVPPFSRSEKVSDYAAQCRPVEWVEADLKAEDGTALKLLEGSVAAPGDSDVAEHLVVVYFQGNASSMPPRLPYLSNILKQLTKVQHNGRKHTIVALSYRGYWKSKGSPSQSGIELDAEAALKWVQERYSSRTKMVVWGQSIGAGVASVGLANLLRNGEDNLQRFSGLILETPFVDLKAMLVALYPQKFLPYRYLAPFLWSTWDSKAALYRIGQSKPKLRVLILEAGDDEIVPSGQAEILEGVCKEKHLEVERRTVARALHTEVMVKGKGRSHIVKFLQSF